MIDGLTGLDTVKASGKGAMFASDDASRLKADVTASTPLPITIDSNDEMMKGFARFSRDMSENIRASEAPTITDLIIADGNLRSIVPNGFILLANKLDALIQRTGATGLIGSGGTGLASSPASTGEANTATSPLSGFTSSAVGSAIGVSLAQSIAPTIASLIGTIEGAVLAIGAGTLGVTLLAEGMDSLAQKVMTEEKYKEMMDTQTEALKQGYVEVGGYDGATISGPKWFTDWVTKNDLQFQTFSYKIQSMIKSAYKAPLVIPEDPDPQVVIPQGVVDLAEGVKDAVDNSVADGAKEAFDQGYVEFGDGSHDKGLEWLKGLFGGIKDGLTKSIDNLAEAVNNNTDATQVQTEATVVQATVVAQNGQVTPMSAEEAIKAKMASGGSANGIYVNVNNMPNVGYDAMYQQARRNMAFANSNAGGTVQSPYINSGIGWEPLSAGSIMPYSSFAPMATAL